MERFNILLVLLVVLVSCKDQETSNSIDKDEDITTQYSTFGENIGVKGNISAKEMTEAYSKMSFMDTVQVKFKAKVLDVCKAKGCWMKLQLENGQETMVKFKDYGFFVPMDITGKEVIVNGIAFVEEMNVDDQRHYAKDGGKSDGEIAQIVLPKKSFGFEADGVLLKN